MGCFRCKKSSRPTKKSDHGSDHGEGGGDASESEDDETSEECHKQEQEPYEDELRKISTFNPDEPVQHRVPESSHTVLMVSPCETRKSSFALSCLFMAGPRLSWNATATREASNHSHSKSNHSPPHSMAASQVTARGSQVRRGTDGSVGSATDASVDSVGKKGDKKKVPVPKFTYRKQLPVRTEQKEMSIWSLLKQSLGKDLSRITMPVEINEPLSMLQRLAEYMAYSELIVRAIESASPEARVEYVCAFMVASLSTAYKRIKKPFNPILGETYEYVRPDLGFRFVSEQVSHHPPISVFHVQGQGYTFWGSIQPKIRFWGRTVDISPIGNVYLKLKRHKETYSWKYVDCTVRNIFMGKMWIENKGVVEVNCSSSKWKGVVTFKPCDWSGEHNHVEGFVYNGKYAKRAIYGSWVSGMYSTSVAEYEKFLADNARKTGYTKKKKGIAGVSAAASAVMSNESVVSFDLQLPQQTTLWTATPKPASCKFYFLMPTFAITLNELLPNHSQILPPTDSRYRADIKHLEVGRFDDAAEEKTRLEEKQRQARKEDAARGVVHAPRWFKLDGNKEWVFTDTYWDRDWKTCPRIV